MNKKIISVLFAILAILAAAYYFKLSNKVENKTIKEIDQNIVLEQQNDEAIIIEADKVAEEEAEIDEMIDELEELQF